MTFGLTNRPQLFQKFGLTKDTVVLFKKVGQAGSERGRGGGAGSPDPPGVVQFDEGRADFPVDKELGLDQGDLSRFLLTHSMRLVTEYNSEVSGLPGGCGWWASAVGASMSSTCPCRHPLRSLRPGSLTTCCCSSTRRWTPTGSCWQASGRQLPPSGGRYWLGLGARVAGLRGAHANFLPAGALRGGGCECRQRPCAPVLRPRGPGGPHLALHQRRDHQEVRARAWGAGHRCRRHRLLPRGPEWRGQGQRRAAHGMGAAATGRDPR